MALFDPSDGFHPGLDALAFLALCVLFPPLILVGIALAMRADD